MAFIDFIPYGSKSPIDIHTTSRPEVQLWEELKLLRFVTGPQAIYGKHVTEPWIDQAKIYFKDACKCSWNSSGLMYYYSYLNLAKALMVTKRSVSGEILKSTNIYHGLVAQPQSPRQITDFEIQIHPPIHNNRRNIFALLYKIITKHKWPFNCPINVSLSNIIGYCDDISHELYLFYKIPKRNIPVYSLIRTHNNHIWFEMLVSNMYLNILTNELLPGSFTVIDFRNFTHIDKVDWVTAHERTATSLDDHSFVRLGIIDFNHRNRGEQFHNVQLEAFETLRDYIRPQPISTTSLKEWLFIPKALINGINVFWHPLLSDYLFSFVLSTILRYYPHLFESNKKDAFISEAWCNQSAITTLRYFLMEFTKPSLRMN